MRNRESLCGDRTDTPSNPRRAAIAFACAAGLLSVLAAACTEGRTAQDPSQQQQPYDPNNPYAQQGQYPQGQYPQQQPQPTATAPASPLAIPCQNDLICGTHKCNLTTQRCSFPCAANTDCASGFTCMGAGGPTALCVPGAQ